MIFFSHIVEIETFAPALALTRLARAGVCAYRAEKTGAGKIRFRVKSKDLRKIFAIFPRSCYTVNVIGPAGLSRAALWIGKRAALAAAAAAFVLLSFLADLFVLRVRFEGSGSYYAAQALPLLREAGVYPFRLYGRESAARAERALAALPSVSFCALQKEGPVLTVTLEVSGQAPPSVREEALVSPADGVVESLTVLRGRALVAEGEAVRAGQVLAAGEEGAAYPVVRCALLCESVAVSECAEKGEEEEARVLALALLGAEGEPVRQEVFVSGGAGKYVYRAEVTYRRLCSVGF